MRRATGLVALALALAAPAAAVAAPTPAGATCTLGAPRAVVDGTWTAPVAAGPLVVTGATGTVTCTVQVGGSAHSDPDAAAVTGPSGAAMVAAGTVTYDAGPDDTVYVCTRVDLADGTTLYWAAPPSKWDDGTWSTDPSSSCVRVTGPNGPECDQPYTDPDCEPYRNYPDRLLCDDLGCAPWTTVPERLLCPLLDPLPIGCLPIR